MVDLEFGIPSQRKRKENPYKGQSVMIMYATPLEKGKAYKFELTPEAKDHLSLPEKEGEIAFAFSGDEMYLGNVTGLENPHAVVLTNTNTFSNKKYHQYLLKQVEQTGAADIIFDVIPTDDENVARLMPQRTIEANDEPFVMKEVNPETTYIAEEVAQNTEEIISENDSDIVESKEEFSINN